jgi:hypothetical protein
MDEETLIFWWYAAMKHAGMQIDWSTGEVKAPKT